MGRFLNRVEKLIVVLYYYEELSEFEIAVVLEISESRIHELRQLTIEKLKKLFKL